MRCCLRMWRRLSCVAADDGFDARRDATSRAYCYRVLAAAASERVRAGAGAVVAAPAGRGGVARVRGGAWSASTTSRRSRRRDTEHVRFSRRCSRRTGGAAPAMDVLEFWIEADAFMRQMIRVLVGTMLEVGGGRRSVASFVELLGGRPRSCAGAHRAGARAVPGRRGVWWRAGAVGRWRSRRGRRCAGGGGCGRGGGATARRGCDAPATACHAPATTSSQLCN